MLTLKQVRFFLCIIFLMAAVTARPDSADSPPLPGPGLSYGGIPYGSMSGNVAEYFNRRRAPSALGARSLAVQASDDDVEFTPIEQWL